MSRKPEQIVDEQVRKWTYLRQSTARRGSPERVWPAVTISREFWARGTVLADALSQRIGFAVWDRELVRAIAEASGGEEAIMQTLDEHRRGAIDDAVHVVVTGSRHTNVTYHKTLVRVVRALSAQGASIIVGRGANYICPPDDRLSVRVVCPLGRRVKAYAAEHGIPEREAQRIVEACDADRADFVRRYFHREVDAAADYDVLINSATFSASRMVDVVLSAYEAKFGERPASREEHRRPSAAGT